MNEWTQVLNLLVAFGLFYGIWWITAQMMPRSARFLTGAARRAGKPIRTQAQRRGWLFALLVPCCGGLGIFSLIIGWAESDAASIVGGIILVLVAWLFLRLFKALERLSRGRTALPGRPRHKQSPVFQALQTFRQGRAFKGGRGSQVPIQTVNIWLVVVGLIYYFLSQFID